MHATRLAALGAALTLGISTAIVAQPPAGRDRPAASATDTTRRGDRTLRKQGVRDRGPRDRAVRAGRGQRRALFQNVNLTKAQQEQVRTIMARSAEQRRALLQNAPRTRRDSTARTQLRAQTRELQTRQLNALRTVLSAEQRRTFDANVAKVRDRNEARVEAPRPHAPRRGVRAG